VSHDLEGKAVLAEPNIYFLTTARLGFRHWRTQDLPLALALWGDEEVTRLIGGLFSEQEVERRLDREIECQDHYEVQYWPVFLLKSNEHAGCAGLRPYRMDQKLYELGFHFKPAFWGQGLAEEAARAVVTFAFENLAVRGLFAGHHPANAASRKLLAKLGFQSTGVLRSYRSDASMLHSDSDVRGFRLAGRSWQP
jgi:[ribosomal protein S5]-alanine N-acetyltransferase